MYTKAQIQINVTFRNPDQCGPCVSFVFTQAIHSTDADLDQRYIGSTKFGLRKSTLIHIGLYLYSLVDSPIDHSKCTVYIFLTLNVKLIDLLCAFRDTCYLFSAKHVEYISPLGTTLELSLLVYSDFILI